MVGLPTELILAIIDRVEDDEDLLLLAKASRLFNELALVPYFSRNAFDPNPRNLILESSDGCIKHLSGLVVSLGTNGASLEHLSYDLRTIIHTDHFIKEVRLLRQYILKLSTVDRFSFRLARYFNFKGNPNEWVPESILLLQTVLQKSCRNIHVMASHLLSLYDGTSVKDFQPLESLFHPTFFRPFYYHTLECNAETLTELSFKDIFEGGSDWATMITNITFPRLTRLAVIYGVIPLQPMAKFITKHSNIQELEYHYIRYDPRPEYPTPLNPTVFEHLHSIVVAPENVLNFLPPMARMLSLKNITIKIEEQTQVISVASLEGALRCPAACVNKITLILEVTPPGLSFDAWFNTVMHTGLTASGRPESSLGCVETLVMDNGEWGFDDDSTAARLPAWLKLFPALRVLIMKGPRTPSGLRSYGSDALLEMLRDTCPGIYIEWGQ